MNYFKLFDIPVNFEIDLKALKQKYYELSKRYHPDFNLNLEVEEQIKSLEISSKLNLAYKSLQDFDSRLKHILELKSEIQEGEKFELGNNFLMEMMDVNEAIMELDAERPDESKLASLSATINEFAGSLKAEIDPVISAFNFDTIDTPNILVLKSYYYKRKYLLRISKSLDKFAPA